MFLKFVPTQLNTKGFSWSYYLLLAASACVFAASSLILSLLQGVFSASGISSTASSSPTVNVTMSDSFLNGSSSPSSPNSTAAVNLASELLSCSFVSFTAAGICLCWLCLLLYVVLVFYRSTRVVRTTVGGLWDSRVLAKRKFNEAEKGLGHDYASDILARWEHNNRAKEFAEKWDAEIEAASDVFRKALSRSMLLTLVLGVTLPLVSLPLAISSIVILVTPISSHSLALLILAVAALVVVVAGPTVIVVIVVLRVGRWWRCVTDAWSFCTDPPNGEDTDEEGDWREAIGVFNGGVAVGEGAVIPTRVVPIPGVDYL